MCLARHLKSSLVLVGLLLVSSAAFAIPEFNLNPGATTVAREQYELHMVAFWICVAIGVVVFGVMAYSMIHHRKSKGVVPATFHENPKLEFIWAFIPFLILIGLAVPATKVLMQTADYEDSAINIKVTGYQWKWHYEYLDEGISYFSNLSTPRDEIENKAPKNRWYLLEVDKPMVVPIHTKVRFLVTSNDVLHSWYVPALGVKRDAVPGYIHEAWAKIDKPGIYRGQCAELCGVEHGYMPIVVEAKTQEDYDKWVEEQSMGAEEAAAKAAAAAAKTWTKDELMKEGETAYDKYCAVCHQRSGEGMPPAFPALKGSPIALGPIDAHIDIVLNGKAGSAMQAFGGQMSDVEIAAVVTYERNAWGNDKKLGNEATSAQPKDIAEARNKS